MTAQIQRRWGILALAVLMFLATIIITLINGSKTSLYYFVWIMVGYYAYKARLSDIKTMMKVLIYLNITVLALVIIFTDTDSYSYIAKGGKSDLIFGVLVMLVPKILLFFYCKKQLENPEENSHSSAREPVSSSQKERPNAPPSLVTPVGVGGTSAMYTNTGSPKPSIIPESSSKEMLVTGGSLKPYTVLNSAQSSAEVRGQNVSYVSSKGSANMGIDESVEEGYWATAMAEVESNQRRPGVWAKAFAEADGDLAKAEAAYLKARVEQMFVLAQAEAAKLVVQQRDEAVKAQALALAKKQEIEEAVFNFINSGTISEANLKLLVSEKDLSNIIHIRDLIKGNTLLHVCAESDMLEEVQRLLAAGASPKEPNNRGLRPENMTKNADIRWLFVEGSLSPDKLEVMRELGIKVERNAFCFSGYRYERLEDAIAFARRSPKPLS